jgi:hypothetical protein
MRAGERREGESNLSADRERLPRVHLPQAYTQDYGNFDSRKVAVWVHAHSRAIAEPRSHYFSRTHSRSPRRWSRARACQQGPARLIRVIRVA